MEVAVVAVVALLQAAVDMEPVEVVRTEEAVA